MYNTKPNANANAGCSVGGGFPYYFSNTTNWEKFSVKYFVGPADNENYTHKKYINLQYENNMCDVHTKTAILNVPLLTQFTASAH